MGSAIGLSPFRCRIAGSPTLCRVLLLSSFYYYRPASALSGAEANGVTRMTDYDYDLFVIGAGSGGVRAARVSAGFGARVAVCEERYLGGTCVNVGCVPKKLFVHAAHYARDLVDAGGYGWQVGETRFDWSGLLTNKNREIERLQGVYARLLSDAGVEVMRGHAVLLDAHTVAVGDTHYTARYILVATGGRPVVPAIAGKEHAIVSDDAFFLPRLPRRCVVVGGGYIAVEFAGIFHGLGVETTLIYRGELFLRGFDDEVRAFLAKEMVKCGIDLRFNTEIAAVVQAADGLTVALKDGGELVADSVMYAIGRRPNTAGLGLEPLGVQLTPKGAIVVDGCFQSSVASLYAIGDVTDRINLTPVALAEGMALARRLFDGGSAVVDYTDVPTAVFSQPNIGTVGLTEAEARQRFGEIDVFRSEFKALKHSLSGSDEQTLMKLVVARSSDKVVGVHMVGSDAGEIIQGLAVAIRAGATKACFDTTIGIHPTAAEEFVSMREPVAH